MIATIGQIALSQGALLAAGAAAMAVPIAIHLLARLQRRPQPWGAMRFLIEAYQRHRHRLRLEQWLLLAARCLILLLLGLALSGPWISGFQSLAGLGPPRRTFCFVLDDSITTQALGPAGQPQFDTLKRKITQALDQLAPSDRVGLWLAARPPRQITSPSAGDPQSVKKALESIQPRFSRADIPSCLAQIESNRAQHPSSVDQTYLVITSPLARSSLPLNKNDKKDPQAITQSMQQLGELSRLLVTQPAPAPTTVNLQIAGLTPVRRTLLASGPWNAASIEVQLRRFSDDQTDQTTTVELRLFDPQHADPLTTARKQHRWVYGQSQVTLLIDLPLPDQPTSTAPNPDSPTPMWIEARLTSDHADLLTPDDTRWTLIELKNRLVVGLIDQPRALATSSSSNDQPTPADWLTAALTPNQFTIDRSPPTTPSPNTSTLDPGLQILSLDASQLTAARLAPVDVAMILRPDLLSSSGWDAIAQWVRQGGTVWVFTPPAATNHAWTSPLNDHFTLNWQFGLEPQSAPADHPWSLASDRPAPPLLNMLAADWTALTRPIRVMKLLPLTPLQTPDETWLATDTGQPLLVSTQVNTTLPETHDRGDPNKTKNTAHPLLQAESFRGQSFRGGQPPRGDTAGEISQETSGENFRGGGRLLVFTTAIDPTWTNLPTKPFFLPLIQEAIRAAAGDRTSSGLLTDVVCGDQPTLPDAWQTERQLTNVVTPSPQSLSIQRNRTTNDHVERPGPVDQPGVYLSETHPDVALVANPDALGGDTRPLSQDQITDWLRWSQRWDWLDPSRFRDQITAQATQSHLGWPLLWVVFTLVLIETLLARWFSHVGGLARTSKHQPPKTTGLIRAATGVGP